MRILHRICHYSQSRYTGGGRLIPEDELFVSVGNSSIAWRHLDSDNDSRVTPGDQITILLRDQDKVAVVWRVPPDGSGTETIGR